MMKNKALVFNPIQENTYVVWDETAECIILDAGMMNHKECQTLEQFIAQKGLKPVMAVNTHGHFDHLMGVEWLKERYGVPFALSSKDQYLLDATKEGSVVYGMVLGAMPSKADIDLDEVEQITFGTTTLKVIKTPGHTPGHVSLFNAETKELFTGDTLFRECIGRTDLPGGDYSMLMSSIITEILPLGDEVVVYPGHEEETTIGHEALYNSFIVEVINDEVNYK